VVTLPRAPDNITKTNLSSQSGLSWDIVQAQGGEVDVYLKGPSASKVVGADLKVFFGSDPIKISLVEAGGFFINPIVIKFDNKNLSYSLILNPENKASNDLSKPLLKFHLSSGSLTGNKFYTLSASQVYLLNIGGAFPKTSQIILK
jgi:hypothetical protein